MNKHLVAVILAAGAAVLALTDHNAWHWFLGIAVFLELW